MAAPTELSCKRNTRLSLNDDHVTSNCDDVNLNCDRWGNHGTNYNCNKYIEIEGINDEIAVHQRRALHICQINIVSLNKNIGKIEEFLAHVHFTLDVICRSETRLNNGNSNSVKLPGYTLYYNNSPMSAGGTAICVNDSLQCVDNISLRMNIESCQLCEDVWVDITLACIDIHQITWAIFRRSLQATSPVLQIIKSMRFWVISILNVPNTTPAIKLSILQTK